MYARQDRINKTVGLLNIGRWQPATRKRTEKQRDLNLAKHPHEKIEQGAKSAFIESPQIAGT